MSKKLHRLGFDLEGRLKDMVTNRRVKATALRTAPQQVSFDASGVAGPGRHDDEYFIRLDKAVQSAPFQPEKANAYVPGLSNSASSTEGRVCVAIQHYKIYGD